MVGGSLEKGLVVHRARPGVAWNRVEGGSVRAGKLRRRTVLDHRDRVGLAQVEAGVVEASDLGRNHQVASPGSEGAPIADSGHRGVDAGQLKLGGKAELENNVFGGIVVVVDLDFVKNIRVKREECGSVRRLEQRIHAQDHGDLARPLSALTLAVVAHKGKHVRDVCLVIEGRDRRLAVVGCLKRCRGR